MGTTKVKPLIIKPTVKPWDHLGVGSFATRF